MIVALLGKAGAGKTYIAEKMEEIVPDSFIIDGDDLRAETGNVDIGLNGREQNIHLGYSRARWLADLGFTVFVAMQAPIKEIREQYLNENDIQVIVTNKGPNPKDEMGYNDNFAPDYSGVDCAVELTEFDPYSFYDQIFKKVLIIARFQSMHRGHKIIFEEAKRLSPNITVALRVDKGDVLSLDENIKLIRDIYPNYNYVKSPNIDDSNRIWEDFVKQYDVVVQGNPDVIKKFQKAVDDELVDLHYVPRIGHISATKIREAIKNGNEEFAKKYVADPKVLEFLKEEIT
jgi:phosphopantetheine adenylyltransferase